MILLHTANASLFVNTEEEIIVENTLLTKYIAKGNAETHICLRRKKNGIMAWNICRNCRKTAQTKVKWATNLGQEHLRQKLGWYNIKLKGTASVLKLTRIHMLAKRPDLSRNHFQKSLLLQLAFRKMLLWHWDASQISLGSSQPSAQSQTQTH